MILINIALLALLNLFTVTSHAAAAMVPATTQQKIRRAEREMSMCVIYYTECEGAHMHTMKMYWKKRWVRLSKEIAVLREDERYEGKR